MSARAPATPAPGCDTAARLRAGLDRDATAGTIRALVVGETGRRDSLALVRVPAPAAGPGQILVRVHAAALNFPDLLMIDGKYQIRPPAPFVLGKDAAGEVIGLGAGAEGVVIGDRVLVQTHYGAFADVIAVDAAQAFRLPPQVGFVDAAAFGLVYKTAWLALADRAGLRPGDRVLVTGAAGGVGLAAVQTARALGAGTVIAGLTTLDKAPAVLAAGADAVVDTGAAPEAARARISALTDGHGIDVALDVLGGAAFDLALKTLAWKGRLISAGYASGDIPAARANLLLLRNAGVLGFSSNTYDEQAPELVRAAFDQLFALLVAGRLRPVIHAALEVEAFARAFDALAGRRVVGKVVLTFHPSRSSPPLGD
ncbi:NADPH:quinone oxidoreductase family protein [Xanthobacter sp. V4C-4]|uniref:NADPH:quinone oxidoreductase family protein n=1 Tax=Xanthobacter cornucopiae TaxID=3119924 RepID=UPI0037284FB2